MNESMRCSKPRILSIVNALAYALNALETFGYGPFSASFSTDQDNATISAKYQTIITPHGIAFSIWGLIFLGEAVFCVLPLLCHERFGTHPLMVEGVSFYFVAVCLAQTAWSPAFAHERMPLSAALMACILAPLVAIAVRQYDVVTKALEAESTNVLVPRSCYWALQFPFELHLGWIVAAFALSVNILAVAWGGDALVQQVVAGASLVALAIVSFACLWGLERPQYTIPSVAAWATYWMSFELRNPKDLIKDTFTDQSIRSFRVLTLSLSGILASVTVFCWVYRSCVPKRKTYSNVDGSAISNSLI